MSKQTTGLGRGLSSLIPPKHNNFETQAEQAASRPELRQAQGTQIVEIPVEKIEPNPLQPRQHFDEKSLEELMQSIETYGLLEPVVVTPEEDGRYQLVAGERRFRSHQKLGKATIQAIIREASDLERLELALIENIQREDLNPIEKAHSMAKLVNEFGLTQAVAAKKLGVARSTLANSIRLLDLPTEMQHALAQRRITEGHAKILLGLESDTERQHLFERLTSGKGMSVHELSDVAGKQSKKKKKRSIRDHQIQALEDSLQDALGTKVTLKTKSSGGRQIIIDTYSDEEFKRVVKKLK